MYLIELTYFCSLSWYYFDLGNILVNETGDYSNYENIPVFEIHACSVGAQAFQDCFKIFQFI